MLLSGPWLPSSVLEGRHKRRKNRNLLFKEKSSVRKGWVSQLFLCVEHHRKSWFSPHYRAALMGRVGEQQDCAAFQMHANTQLSVVFLSPMLFEGIYLGMYGST